MFWLVVLTLAGVGRCRWMVVDKNGESRVQDKIDEEEACTSRVCWVGGGRDDEFCRRHTMAVQSR